jgi:hypothetical protein
VIRSRKRTKALSRGKFHRASVTKAANGQARLSNVAQALLVLGMHRGGTSALTRVLSLLGAALPKNLTAPEPSNPTGHWEPWDIVSIHDDLLPTAGSRWDDWRAFNPDWAQSRIAEDFRKKLLAGLQNDFNGSSLFVVKDPRICRFVPLWLDLLDRFGAEARVVILLRNPLEVAASLKRRDNFPPAKSYLLWLRHVIDAEKATRHLPRGIVTYNDLLNDWRGVVRTISAKTGVHWPRRSDHSELEIDRFLADELRHHVADDAQLTARADIADWVKETYHLLQNMANKHATRDQFKRLDRVHSEFEKACATFGLVLVAEAEQSAAQLQSAETQIKTRDEDVIRLSGELTQAQSAANEAQVAAAVSHSQAATLAAELEAARADGERKIAEIGAQLAASSSETEELNRQRDRFSVALEEEKAAAALNNAQVAALGLELETMRNTIREREAAAAQLQADLDKARSLANDRKTELDKLSRELASGQAALRDRGKEIERLSYDIEATRRSLRDSQTEVQRLAGELDGARVEIERADAERRRTLELLRAGHEAISATAAELPVVREEIAVLESALEGLRQEDNRRRRQINESSKELQSAAAKSALQENEVGAHDIRIRDLEARLDEKSAENDRLAGELVRTAAEARRVEKNAVERAGALDAVHAAALAESENRAQAQIRRLRDYLVDAEAALAKAGRERKEASWAGPFSESRRAARALRKSGLVDAEWYLREYSDVAKSGRAPAEHYVAEGYARGYQPNPFFDTRWYLERYDDVRRSGKNPLLHYIQYGCREGRDPGPNFQTRYYLESNPDVRSTGVNPLAHYLRHGRHEGRLPAPRA